ncbi:hypothetical protein V8E54_002895 [Elaphomyces granulatus]
MESGNATTVKDLGFTILADPEDAQVDIVLLHGLQGHPQKTWAYFPPEKKKLFRRVRIFQRMNKAISNVTGFFWPCDILPGDFPRARIMTYGYDSHVTHWFKGPAMQLDIDQYGKSLLNAIEARRRDDSNRPLIFIVHSLGGLIVKDAIRQSKNSNEERFKNVYNSIQSLVFLGTPHRGGSYLELGLTASKIAALAGFNINDRLIRNLSFASSTARILQDEFVRFLQEQRPTVFTFQEGQGLTGFGPLSGKVVEDFSSALDYVHEQKDTIAANHMDMCRFKGGDDDGYIKIKDALSLAMSNVLQETTATGPYQNSQNHQIPYNSDEIIKSLYFPDTEERFQQVEEAYTGTCDWIFHEEIGFSEWLRTGSGIFWIQGKPASGKSVLMKSLISDPRTLENLLQNNSTRQWICIEFFFNSGGNQTQRSLSGLVGHVLYQILKHAPALGEFVAPVYQDVVRLKIDWSLQNLQLAAMNTVNQQKVPINLCLFVDALDEHESREQNDHLQTFLRKFIESNSPTVKTMLCLSSRPEPIFKDLFSKFPSTRLQEHSGDDISTYVNGRMKEYLSSRGDLTGDSKCSTILRNMCEEIIQRAHGVFLWVKLVVTMTIESLVDGNSVEEVEVFLQKIPDDLFKLYSLILDKLRQNYMLDAFKMLQIADAAAEPLSISDFILATDFARDPEYNWKTPGEEAMERRLYSRCRGFLEVRTSGEEGLKVVQFLHKSAQDFLLETEYLKTMQQQLSLGPDEIGHVYLLRFYVHRTIKDGQCRYNKKLPVFHHAKMVEQILGKPVIGPLDELGSFIDRNQHARSFFWSSHIPANVTFLGLTINEGLTLYVKSVLQRKANVVNLDNGLPVLHYLVIPRNAKLEAPPEDMLNTLLDFGADIDAEFQGLSAVAFGVSLLEGMGAVCGFPGLELVLKSGCNPDSPKRRQNSPPLDQEFVEQNWPLARAMRRITYNAQIMKLLLDYGSDIDLLSDKDLEYIGERDIKAPTLNEWERENRKAARAIINVYKDRKYPKEWADIKQAMESHIWDSIRRRTRDIA